MEGYWINIDTGEYEEVWEHASWIQDISNQKKIGLDPRIGNQIMSLPASDFKGKSREDIVLLAIQGGLIRVRRYGGAISFEFQIHGRRRVLNAIRKFLVDTDIPNDYTSLTITNLATNESIGILWKDFSERMRNDDIESILRIAEKVGRREYSVIGSRLVHLKKE